jgi:biopolymer transport protein ExbB
MEEAGRRVAGRLERYLGMLAAMATVAPLLGLLGTVTGMIEVFQRVDDTIQATGDVQAGVLASGIWEALMTTAAGLSVAIPAFIAARYLHGRVDNLVGELEERADVMADLMAAPRPASPAAPSAEAPEGPARERAARPSPEAASGGDS